MFVNHQAIAPTVIALWKRGGLDTLIKVAPLGVEPDPARMIGYCTTLKYFVGRTPAEIEAIIGLTADSKLAGGADIFTVDPLPSPDEFELRGYTHCPGEMPADAPGHVSHPIYSPGRGAPQWDLVRVPQSRLVRIARVQAGQIFAFEARWLAPRRQAGLC
jgi:hypothetical protein